MNLSLFREQVEMVELPKKMQNATPGVPAMGVSNTGSRAQTTTKLSVLRRKLAARLVSVKK